MAGTEPEDPFSLQRVEGRLCEVLRPLAGSPRLPAGRPKEPFDLERLEGRLCEVLRPLSSSPRPMVSRLITATLHPGLRSRARPVEDRVIPLVAAKTRLQADALQERAKSIEKQAPPPSLFLAVTRPCCRRMISLEIGRPRPVPPAPVRVLVD